MEQMRTARQRKLVKTLLSGQLDRIITMPRRKTPDVSQVEIAKIQDLSRRKKEIDRDLKTIWEIVRTKLKAGAHIEDGPLTVWFDHQVIRRKHHKQIRRSLMRVA